RLRGDAFLLLTPVRRLITYQPSFYSTHDIHTINGLINRANARQRRHGKQQLFFQVTETDNKIQSSQELLDALQGTEIPGVTILSRSEYEELDTIDGISQLMGSQVLFVGDASTSGHPRTIDNLRLSRIGSCTLTRQARDPSLQFTSTKDDHIIHASFTDFMHQLSWGEEGKILTFLDIPSIDDRYATPSLSTNKFSQQYNLDYPVCDRHGYSVPVQDTNWHIVATSDTTRANRIAADGFNTEIFVKEGAVLIFLCVPPMDDPGYMAKCCTFTEFALNLSDSSSDIIGLLLLPGDRM
ncbi:hypothetical protein MPER_11529, partial [Moniliophthora perniciosa FA553]